MGITEELLQERKKKRSSEYKPGITQQLLQEKQANREKTGTQGTAGRDYIQEATQGDRMAEIARERTAAQEQLWENPIPNVRTGLQQAALWRTDPETARIKTRERTQAYLDAQNTLKALEREEAQINYIRANDGKTFDDNFFGQFGASYALGRMRQDESLAWNKYLEDPTEENRAYAEAIGQLANKFEQENEATLAPDATLPWVSQSLANYLPQLADQVKYSAVGAIGGGAAGSAIPVLGTAAGIKAGITAASGLYSYQTMRGAAFKSLLDLGVDEETAKAAANDEAVVSGLIEMADTGIDLMTLGGGKLISALTKGGVKNLAKQGAEKAAESAGKKLLKALGKYGLNVGFEWTEEATQQAVSIANANRAESGTDNGIFGLAGDAAKVFWNAIKDQEDENHAEILEAGAQGAIIAGLMGPLQAGVNQLAYTGVTELADYGQQLRQKKMENTVIEAGLKFEEGSQVRRMADAISQKQKSGQQITDVELGDLYRAIKLGQQQAYQTTVQQAQEEARRQESAAAQQAEGILLPTADEVEARERAAAETNPTRRSGILAGAREADIESAARLSEALGRDVEFFREEAGPAGTVNGYYNRETGTIYINSRSQNPVAQIIAHELTHSVEMAESYGELKTIAMEQLEREGVDIAKRRQELRERYARNNKPLQDDVEADQEIVAQFVEQKLLTDEQTILELTRTNRTLMERILEWINRTLQKLGVKKTTERDTLERAREIYARALQESGREQQSDQGKDTGAYADLQEARGRLRRDLERGEITEEEYDAAMETVLEEESLLGVSSLEETAYSISESFADEIEQWNGEGNKTFHVGTTSAVLQSIGIEPRKIIWRGDKILKILNKHKTMTKETIKQVPNILENPVAILKSKQYESRIVLFGDIVDLQGKPVTAILELQPTTRGGQLLRMNIIASAYGKDNAKSLIKSSDLVYLDPNKNRTDTWLQGLGLQLPSNATTYGSMGSITYGDNTVNISGIPFREIGSTKQPWDNQKNRYSISDGQERRNAETALEHFGETEKWAETGYLTVDGRRLDFSGRHWGGDGGYREVDHRDISEALGDDYGGEDYSGALIRFMAEGNIRISPESYGVDLSVRPTDAQEKALRDYFDWADGAVTLDISSTEGATITSVEYPEGTSADRIIKDIRRYFDSGEKPRVSETQKFRYSISETYAKEIEDWDAEGRSDGKVFVLGATGDVLQGLGAMEQDIYLRSEKINKILQEHPEMTLEEIKRVPEILDDPVLIMKSRNRKGKNSRLVIFGAVKAKNGKPILSVLDLLPSEGRLQIDDMQKVNSAYTRDNARNYIEGGEILYADGRRTIPLLNAVSEKNHRDSSSDRLAHTGPIGLLRSGSMGSITYGDNTVNISGIPFREIVSTKQSWDDQKNRYSISDDEEPIQSGITLPMAEDVMGEEKQDEAGDVEQAAKSQDEGRDAEQDMDARARAEGSGDIFTPEDIAEEEARRRGYPVIDGKQIMPLKSWVRDRKVGNYGLVTNLGKYEGGKLKSLEILFRNKEEDAAAYVNVPLEQLEWVPGEYQPTDAEINARMEAEPEEITPEDRTELYTYLDQRDADLGKREEPWTPVAIEKLKPKALTFLERAERDMVTRIGKSLGIPYRARRELLKGPVREMTAEYLKTGQISKETKRRLFDQAYEASIGKAKEFLDQYKPLRDHLRNTKLEISKKDSADIPDFNSYRKRSFGRLNISTEGGTNMDQVYKELAETWPEFFDEQRESTTGDRLNRISEVLKNFQAAERNLKEYNGPEADTFKKFAYNDYEEAVYSQIHDLQAVARYQSKRQAQQQEQTPKTLQEVVSLWEQYKKEKRTYDKVAARNLLTDRDEVLVGQLLRGEITEFALDKEKNNVKGIMAVYEAKKEYDRIAKELRAWNAERRSRLKELADQYLETAKDWKDKKAGILYSRETMERNIRDIVPDKALAQRIIDEYFTPVHKAAADATRLKNELRDQVKNMNLSRDVAEGNLVSEAHAVQLLGEAEDNIRFLERAKWKKERDGKTAAEWRKVVDDLWEENPNLDKEKIKGAVEQFRTIYDDLFRQMNEVRVRNGYEPINYRSGYFPHFQPGEGDGIIAAFGRALGISTEVTALPTSISGLTHTFKPGIQWFGNAQERLGFNTAYDAVEGFDKYIEGAADVIYQTDNIQKLRQFGNQVRYRTTDKGIQKQVDAVLNNDKLSETEKQHQIDDIFTNARFSMSNFVAELEEYTNLLANKKSKHDRSVEADVGRDVYNLVKTLEGRVAANMVSINPASWLTNLIPLTQAWAGVRNTDILRGMWDTLRGMNKHDGVVERSTFLTNRRGSDPLVKAWEQGAKPEKKLQRAIRKAGKAAGKMGDKLSSPMEVIDNFTSESLIRARYAQNLRKGLSEQNAMDEADAWVAGVMADRSKGAVPTLFMRKNPFTKLVTQFQLEVNNQLSYLFKDIPRETKQAGVKVMTWAFLKFAIGAWLYDELYEFLIGRRPALDPIGILLDTVEDLTEPEEETSLYDTAANLGAALLEQVPFTGALNLFGADLDAGRLPISNAIPDLTSLGKGLAGKGISANKRADLFLRELADTAGAYLVLPFGGGQLKKILQTAEAVVRGGRYSVNNEGELQLQYPVFNDEAMDRAGNAIFGSVFGPTTLPTGREWIENGFGTLSVDQTIAYEAMKEAGAEDETAFQVIQDYRAAENNEERREVIRNADINGDAKAALYYQLMASDKEQQQLDILDDAGQDMGQIIDTLLDIKDMDAAAREDGESDEEKPLFTEEQMEVVSKAGLKENDAALAAVERENIWANRELTTDEKKAEFSQWLKDQGYSDEEQHALYNAVIEGGKSESEAGEENRYVKLVRSGIDSDIAYAITSDISRLEPPEGAESVSREQKRRVVFDRLADPEQQLKALETVNLESQQQKFVLAFENGVMPEVYAAVIAEMPNYDEDGNGSLNQEEVKNALNSMGRGAFTLPGGESDFTLSRQDKAVIWQLCNKSWKNTSNPFGEGVGKRIYDALNPDKEK